MYQGKSGFIWYTGVVEDRNDPLFQNRVRVRIHGSHTWDKQKIASADLPWCQVLMPVTAASVSGIGTSHHGLVEGSTIMGFYRDAEQMQDPVVMGSFTGIQTDTYRIDEKIDDKGNRTFTEVKRTPTEGFNDPRLDSKTSYKGTPDGPNPKHINRNYGLTLGLDKSPRRSGSSKGELYPKTEYQGSPSVNHLAKGLESSPMKEDKDSAYPVINISSGEPKRSYVKPLYPFNHVHETESGHVLELDDTPDQERIHLYHRKGTRVEIDKDGNYVEKIVKNKYSVILADDHLVVSGKVTVKIEGDANIEVGGETNLTSTGEISMVAPKINLNSGSIPDQSVGEILETIDDAAESVVDTVSSVLGDVVATTVDAIADYTSG